MSWQLSRRLTPIHYAVSIALLYSVSSVALPIAAQAATIGKTIITSAQHEPLAASIMVTDIKPTDFTVGLAKPTVYQQMGLTPTTSMSVRFVATSANSGHVIINTVQPVSMPFADIVLTLNEKGQHKIMPKTLLLPLANSHLLESPNIRTANTQMSNLLIKNLAINKGVNTQPLIVRGGMPPPLRENNTETVNTQPLMVRSGMPPSLFTPANASRPIQMRALSQNTVPKTESNATLLRVNLSPISASSLGMPAAPKTSQIKASQTTSNMSVMTASTAQTNQSSSTTNTNVVKINTVNNQALTAQSKQVVANFPSIRTTNKSLDIFTVQVTRRIQASDRKMMPVLAPTILAPTINQPSLSANVAKALSTQSPSLSVSELNATNSDTKAATNKNLQAIRQHIEPQNNFNDKLS